jgi:hypothetical protein
MVQMRHHGSRWNALGATEGGTLSCRWSSVAQRHRQSLKPDIRAPMREDRREDRRTKVIPSCTAAVA